MFQKSLLILIALAIVFSAGAALANGTTAGTVISNYATANFNSSNGTAMPAATSSTQTNSVSAMYGISSVNNPLDVTVLAGRTNIFAYTFVNGGNSPDYFYFATNDSKISNTFAGSNWTITYYLDDGDLALDIGVDTVLNEGDSFLVAESASVVIFAYIDTPLDATGGLGISYPFELYTTNVPNGFYTNTDLSVVYAGYSNLSTIFDGDYSFTFVGKIPDLYISKSFAVDSSILASYEGGASDPVPGARVTYTISYDNDGPGDANNLIIEDMLPANTTYDPGSFAAGTVLAHTQGVGNVTLEWLDLTAGPAWVGAEPATATDVGGVRIVINAASTANVQGDENSEGTDTAGVVDGDAQDDDAGYFQFSVYID